jgi:periplasmic protein TonB
MLDFTLSGGALLAVLFALSIGLFFLILTIRYYLHSQGSSLVLASTGKTIDLTNRTKYNTVNVFRLTKPIFFFSLSISILFVIVAFGWTTQSYTAQPTFVEDLDYVDLEVIPDRTAHTKSVTKPSLPKTKPSEVILIDIVDDVENTPEPKLLDTSLDADTVIDDGVGGPDPVESTPPVVAPPLPKEVDDGIEPIVRVAEQMPRFPGCENMVASHKEKEDCSKKKLLEYVYDNLRYPSLARENGIAGLCVIQFTVEKDGSISKAKIVKDIGGGCGEAARTVV